MSCRSNTSFTSDDIHGSSDANRAFGEDESLLVARPGKNCCSSFWFTIPDGFYAIVTNHGVQVDYEDTDGTKSCVWPPGLHLGPPWRKISHLVTKQNIVMNTSLNQCKTKDNIFVNIDVAVVFRIMGDKERDEDPQNVYKFVHYVTAKGIEQQLKSAQVEHICHMVRSMNYSEIYGLRKMSDEEIFRNINEDSIEMMDDKSTPMARLKDLTEDEEKSFSRDYLVIDENSRRREETKESSELDHFLSSNHDEIIPVQIDYDSNSKSNFSESLKTKLNEDFNSSGLEIINVILHGITFSDQIQTKMVQKTIFVSNEKEKQAQNRYELLKLRQHEEILTLEQTIEEDKMELNTNGKYASLLESLELLYENGQAQDSIEKIKAQTEMDVNLIKAESEYTVEKIIDATKLEASKITEESTSEAAVVKVDALGDAREIEANACMEGAYFEATGQKALFKAEVFASPMMRNFNSYYSKKLKIQVQAAMADNDKLVITGTSGGAAANLMLMADAALINGKLNDIPDSRRKIIMEELKRFSG